MRALSVGELLSAWEHAYAQRPAQRALALVRAACADDELDPEALSLGERDARLLALRERTFGQALRSVAACEECGERMEFNFTTADILAMAPAEPSHGVHRLDVDEYRVEWRLPTSGDVAALGATDDVAAASARLEESCVVGASRGDTAVAPSELPEAVRQALAQAVADADPLADVEIALPCPACSHQNLVPFDVATFFWDEITAWAHRTLQDVHLIASAYGWPERDILAMTALLRQLYLEMLRA
jgi:hypothetical protein